ncbi:MAG: GNAT family N-acetyltransferase [Burkholderiales bacterium]|nr:GNAT family N-acetyltransferase [Burkholderiales bacterium]
MTEATPTIRLARAQDAAALAALAERTFRDTFGASNRGSDMDLHCARSYGAAIQAAEIAEPRRTTLVADAAGSLAGYAQLRWNATAALIAARPAEIQRIYVDRPWHGRGVAQALMARLLAAAREGGADGVWLGVWERNERALAFYRKAGFEPIGEHEFALGDEVQRDLVLARAP